MAETFDPDAYLAQKSVEAKVLEQFDPDAYLADKERKKISWDESALRGAEQGLTFGFADEAGAGLQAALRWVADQNIPFTDKKIPLPGVDQRYLADVDDAATVYEKARGENREIYKEAQEANQGAYGLGEVGGSLLTAGFIPGGSTLAGAVGSGAAMGAASGLGHGESDLTEGDWNGAALETGLGGVIGGVAGAAGHGLGQGATWLKNKAGAGIRSADADAGQAAALAAQKKVAQARGGLGGETAAGKRALDIMREILDSPIASAEQKAAAQNFLSQPGTQELERRIYANALEAAPTRMGSINTAEEALAAVQKMATPEAIEQTAQNSMLNPVAKQIAPRLRKQIVNRVAVPMLGTALGGFAGGEDHGVMGGVVGTLGGLAIGAAGGNPSTAFENMVRNPGVRKLAWNVVSSVLNFAPQKLGKFAPQLQRTLAEKGPQALAVEAYALHQQNPEFRATIDGIDKDDGEAIASQ